MNFADAQVHPILRMVCSLDISGSTSDETIIHFMQNASYRFDMYDTEKIMNNSAKIPDFYSYPLVGEPIELAVNGMPITSLENFPFTVPLGLKVNSDGNWKIEILDMIDFQPSVEVTLLDAVTGMSYELSQSQVCHFEMKASDLADRFSVVLSNSVDISLSLYARHVLCYNEMSGAVDLVVSNSNQMEYQVLWSNGATTQNLSDLPAGKYEVTVSDANGNSTIDNIEILQPSALSVSFETIDASYVGASDGAVDLTVSGGCKPYYNYLWSNKMSTEDLTNVRTDKYSVTVMDANFCTVSGSTIVNELKTPFCGNGILEGAEHCDDGNQNNFDGCVSCLSDNDFDGIPDVTDNCQTIFNPGQTDTNGNGIGDECDIIIVSVDCDNVPCGKNKVLMCHKPERKNEKPLTICISKNAVKTHLAHGDYCGKCETKRKQNIDNENESFEDNDYLSSSDVVLESFPNPFVNSTTIEFSLPQKELVQVTVFNSSGERVDELFNSIVEKDEQFKVEFTTAQLSPGLYFCRLSTPDKNYYKKLVRVE